MAAQGQDGGRQLDPLHAVQSTGRSRRPLAGGRSRLTDNGVPVLEVTQATFDKLLDVKERQLDPSDVTQYLVGEHVHLHTRASREHGGPDVISFKIGGETLDEAAKTVVGVFEAGYSSVPPSWVASTSDDLAEVLADHYDVPVRGMDEELSA